MMGRISRAFCLIFCCCLVLAPVSVASAQAAVGTISDARLPDGRASDAFDGKNGGTFGAKTVTNLTKSNKVVVAGFNVTYRFYNEAVARVRASYMPGRDTSGASSKIEMNLSGVDDATLQAITDRAYAVFVEQLRLAGREVVPLEQVQPYWPEFSTVKKPSDRKGTYKMFAPSGWPLVTDAVLESGISGIRILQRLSYETGQSLVIVPQIEVNFAEMSSSGNRSGLTARTAEVGAELVMSVSRFDTSVRQVTRFDKWGMKGGGEGNLSQTRAFRTDREFAKLVEKSDDNNSATKSVFDALGHAAGLLNAGGAASSSSVRHVRTTDKAYALAAIDVLNQATGTFAKLFAEYPAQP